MHMLKIKLPDLQLTSVSNANNATHCNFCSSLAMYRCLNTHSFSISRKWKLLQIPYLPSFTVHVHWACVGFFILIYRHLKHIANTTKGLQLKCVFGKEADIKSDNTTLLTLHF